MSIMTNIQVSQKCRSGNGRWCLFSILACAILAFLAVVFLATGVQATVIFDNFDSGGGFSGTDNYVAADAISTPQPITVADRAAAQFVVTGSDFNLNSITLPISFQGTGPNNTLRVRLTGDSGGVPGSTVEVLSLNQIWPAFSNPFTTTTTLTSANHPLLSAGGQYWIVTELTAFVDRNQAVDYRWSSNTSGATVPFLQQQKTGGLPTDPWTATSVNGKVAFRVEGTPVPIPAPFWLFGSGLLGLAGWRRFRKG
jgi:hypothetical protein